MVRKMRKMRRSGPRQLHLAKMTTFQGSGAEADAAPDRSLFPPPLTTKQELINTLWRSCCNGIHAGSSLTHELAVTLPQACYGNSTNIIHMKRSGRWSRCKGLGERETEMRD